MEERHLYSWQCWHWHVSSDSTVINGFSQKQHHSLRLCCWLKFPSAGLLGGDAFMDYTFRKKQFILILLNPHCWVTAFLILLSLHFVWALSFSPSSGVILTWLSSMWPSPVDTCSMVWIVVLLWKFKHRWHIFSGLSTFFFLLSFSLLSSTHLSDLVLLACNWSTMGDVFFVCHHLAALYAYGYVLVSTW